MGSALSLLKGVGLQVSLIFTVGDNLSFLILALSSLTITQARSEKKGTLRPRASHDHQDPGRS